MRNGLPILPLILIASMSSCDSRVAPPWIENNRHMTAAPERDAVPAGLLEDNMKTTRYTYRVTIRRARVTGERGGPPKPRGYVNHVYDAIVLETFKGPAKQRITYAVMADADIKPSLPGYPLIVSLCGSDERGYHVPDNGYVFPASDSLTALARRFSKKNPGSRSGESICGD